MSNDERTDKDTGAAAAAPADDASGEDDDAVLGAEDPGAPDEADAAARGPGDAGAPPAAGRAGAVAWLALFIALVAAAAVGYAIVGDWRAQRAETAASESLSGALDRLRGRVGAAEDAIQALEAGGASLAEADARLTSELERLETRVDERLDLIDSLPARMQSLESSMAALQGISSGARETWLIAEAEYYMQLANAQLQLARNPELALLALGMADERVRQLSNPRLIEVRRALADELAALEAMDNPDIEGTTLTLASLGRVVDSLPLDRGARDDGAAGVEPDAEASGFGRFWTAVKGAFSSAVKITPPDAVEMPFLAPEAETFLRSNLVLKLETARLALLRGEQSVFEQSLDDAESWLGTYFDTGSTQVESALATVREIRENIFTIDPPDISESLRLLRQYRTMAGNQQ